MMSALQPKKALATWQWWLFFGIATWVMSLWFDASRAFFAAPGWQSAMTLGLCMVMLVLAMGVMMYDSYVKHRSAGKVIHPVKPFEWFYQRQFGAQEEDRHE